MKITALHIGILFCGILPPLFGGPAHHTTSGKEPPPLEKAITNEDSRPLPFGIGVSYLYQKQDYRIKQLDADLPELSPPRITKLPPGAIPAGLPPAYAAAAYAIALAQAQEIANQVFAEQIARIPSFDQRSIRNVTNTVQHVNARLDWWVLPMLNLHGVYGQFEGKAEATLAPEIGAMLGDVTVKYDGQSYGGGLTLAAGWRQWFVSGTATYTWSDVHFDGVPNLELSNPDGIETLVIQPRLGYRFSDFSLWLGAQYQKSEHTQTGVFTVDQLGKVPFRVEVEDKHHWSWLAGLEWRLSPHWSINAEAGFGQRRQFLTGITFRF